ncbi:MAG TPA: hypothetical protein VMS29_02260, partial [Pyrinomonadaceae bacterium]|nr:hypothetical protein [Pyrinomonadaceae bacterium]
ARLGQFLHDLGPVVVTGRALFEHADVQRREHEQGGEEQQDDDQDQRRGPVRKIIRRKRNRRNNLCVSSLINGTTTASAAPGKTSLFTRIDVRARDIADEKDRPRRPALLTA